MAGHSKWANIKHRKGAQDAKRGQQFTKIAKEIIISAKLGGGDMNTNPRLRAAIAKGRAGNMPKDNIEKAIKKGTGELEGVNYEEILYEAYGPHGIAIIIEVLTDKKSRTIPELKNILMKSSGNLAEAGSVSYLFDHLGIILIEGENIVEDELLEFVIESGADDFEKDDENIYVIKTQKENFHAALTTLTPMFEEKSWKILASELRYVPKNLIELDKDKEDKVLKLIDILDDHDDIQNVYSNLEESSEEETG
ncbi:MAG: YebC/PmpR family DNA-binding transcriptional regulator [Leptospirales bacterium]